MSRSPNTKSDFLLFLTNIEPSGLFWGVPELAQSFPGPRSASRGHQGRLRGDFSRTAPNKTLVWCTPADPADPPDPAKVVSATAARSLPSTRAGGQDDVSYNKLPQTIVRPSFTQITPGRKGIGTNQIGVRGLPEQDISSLGVMGWGGWRCEEILPSPSS